MFTDLLIDLLIDFFFCVLKQGFFLCVALAVLELILNQAGLELRHLPVSTSLLGLKACATTFRLCFYFFYLAYIVFSFGVTLNL